MSGHRKRRPSNSPECDRKRRSFECYNFDSYIKQESYSHGSKNYNCKPKRHYNEKFVARNAFSDKGNVNSRNYNSGYDNGSQLNFKHEVYINSLRQSEPRHVDYFNLRRRLLDIDIRYLRNRKFYTAFDLAQELESSLKYFVDTRNELVFLRKLQRPQCVPFSYNDIHIENCKGLQNRISFLENESAFRSHRMNQLFRQLQCVVIPSIIDDIRHVHSVSYERSWADGKRYWFSLFKDIKWEKNSRTTIRPHHKYLQSKHQRFHRSHAIKDEFDVANNKNNVSIKSEVVVMPKVEANICEVEISDEAILQALAEIRGISKSIENSKNCTQQSRIDKRDNLGATLSVEEHNVETNDTVEVAAKASVKIENLDYTLSQALSAIREISKLIEKRKAKLFDEGKDDVDDLSGFSEIKEPNVSVVTVTADDLDSSISVIPPEGDNKN